MKLYWHPFSIFPRRVRIALREKQLAYDEVIVDLDWDGDPAADFARMAA